MQSALNANTLVFQVPWAQQTYTRLPLHFCNLQIACCESYGLAALKMISIQRHTWIQSDNLECLYEFVQCRSVQSWELFCSSSHRQTKFHSIFSAWCLSVHIIYIRCKFTRGCISFLQKIATNLPQY